MADLTFAQTARRNYTVPILIAIALMAIAGGLVYRYMPRRTVNISVTHTAVYAVHTVFKAPSDAGGFKLHMSKGSGESDLYVVPTVRIENHLADPLFLKDFTITLTSASGEMHTSAIEKQDLDTVYTAFPAVKPLMPSPLLRETEVAPGQTAEGSLLAQFAIPQSMWDQRKSASITIDFYHQDSMTIPIP